MATNLDPGRWATALLNRLGIQPTPANTRALAGWAKAEGGHWNNQARFNPLNTTQPMPGAGNTGSQGNIKQYKNWQQGLDATVRTLRNGRYQGILDALKSGNESAVANAVGDSPWGTDSGLLARVLGGTSSSAAPTPRVAPSTRTATPGVDRSGERGALIQQFLSDKKADPVDFALGIRALKDTPGRTVTDTSSPVGTSAPRSAATGGPVVDELFYDPLGGWKDGQSIGPIGGHADHVHVGARSHGAAIAIARHAQKLGLHVSDIPGIDKVDPVHVQGSEHYQGRAFDASGDPARQAALVRWIQKRYGIKP